MTTVAFVSDARLVTLFSKTMKLSSSLKTSLATRLRIVKLTMKKGSKMTREEAMLLRPGDIIVSDRRRWRVSGQTKKWKLSQRFRIPLKHGLYTYSALTGENMQFFTKGDIR
jgi:hypothetical protein